MAYWAWKDISAFTYNSQDLKGFIDGGFNVKYSATLDAFSPAGAAWATPLDTGQRAVDPIQVTFKYDGSSTGPAVKAALGTSSTLTLTHATGQSVTGTFIVTDVELILTPSNMDGLQITFAPTGTVTVDYTE